MMMALVKLEARLVRLDERMRFLEANPTVPGGEWEYREAMREWAMVDARLERLRRELGMGR